MFISFLSMWLFACAKTTELSKAPISEAPALKEAAENTVVDEKIDVIEFEVQAFKLDMRDDSRIGFVGSKITKSHTGEFKTFSGDIGIADDEVMTLDVEIDMSSVETDHPKLTEHLKTADFFDVVQFTKATFTASNFENGNITGVLDFHGFQNEISFPAEIIVGEKSASITAEFAINRQLWEVSYSGRKDDLIKDDVLITIDAKFGE